MGNSNDTITLESKTYNKLKAQLEILNRSSGRTK